jgi:catechol 2,3-dioxygenase-like lactoylglutathione lyase family enzyme
MVARRPARHVAALAAGLAILLPPTGAARGHAGRSLALDHVVLAVSDLEATAARYRALGFALKPGRPHANGIRNEHVKFTDGTELELLTAPAVRDALTSRYRQHLADGDGPAFLSLWPRPSAPPRSAAPDYIFFGQGNRSPTDRPEHFAHANTAVQLSGVWLAGANFDRERALLARYGVAPRAGRLDALDASAETAALAGGGTLYFVAVRHRVHPSRPVAGVTFAVRNLDATRRVLKAAGVAVSAPSPSSLLLSPLVAGGLWIEFSGPPGGPARITGPL